jgi:hypothetical protein
LETAAHIAGYEVAWRERTHRPRTLFHQMVMRGVPTTRENQLPEAWSIHCRPVQVLRAVHQQAQALIPASAGGRSRLNDAHRPVL